LPPAGDILSDFHVNVPALDAATLAALRDTKTIEARWATAPSSSS